MMKNTALIEKIDCLPEQLKEQVSDYVDFLLFRYHDSQVQLTAEEKVELDDRWKSYQQNTSSARTLEDIKERFEKKHGISG